MGLQALDSRDQKSPRPRYPDPTNASRLSFPSPDVRRTGTTDCGDWNISALSCDPSGLTGNRAGCWQLTGRDGEGGISGEFRLRFRESEWTEWLPQDVGAGEGRPVQASAAGLFLPTPSPTTPHRRPSNAIAPPKGVQGTDVVERLGDPSRRQAHHHELSLWHPSVLALRPRNDLPPRRRDEGGSVRARERRRVRSVQVRGREHRAIRMGCDLPQGDGLAPSPPAPLRIVASSVSGRFDRCSRLKRAAGRGTRGNRQGLTGIRRASIARAGVRKMG